VGSPPDSGDSGTDATDITAKYLPQTCRPGT
jgi:hypothetical protein